MAAACGLLGLTVCLYADDTDFYLAFINYSLTGCVFYSSNNWQSVSPVLLEKKIAKALLTLMLTWCCFYKWGQAQER